MLKPVRSYSLSIVRAVDVMTGLTLAFVVEHTGAQIVSIRAPWGYDVSPANPQFTEVAEAFLIDQAAGAEEDFRHEAAAKF